MKIWNFAPSVCATCFGLNSIFLCRRLGVGRLEESLLNWKITFESLLFDIKTTKKRSNNISTIWALSKHCASNVINSIDKLNNYIVTYHYIENCIIYSVLWIYCICLINRGSYLVAPVLLQHLEHLPSPYLCSGSLWKDTPHYTRLEVINNSRDVVNLRKKLLRCMLKHSFFFW